MRVHRSLLVAALLVGTPIATTGVAAASVAHRAPAVIAHAPTPFTMSGTITKIAVSKNTVTMLSKKKHYTLQTSTSTVVTIKSKSSTVKRLKVGETIRATGEQLGALYITLAIKASD